MPEPNSGCWLWLHGTIGRSGHCYYGGTTIQRFFYRKLVGPVSSKYDIHHTCENKICINPEHLEKILHWKHTMLHDKNQNTGKIYCKNGHLLAENNLRIKANGQRNCIKCTRKLNRDNYHKNKLSTQKWEM